MIEFQNVCKSFGGEEIFKETTLRINPGDRIGIVGPNGAGKSTFFSLITGEGLPDRGTVIVPRDHRIGYLKQQLPADHLERSLIDFTADAIPELKMMIAELKELEHRMSELQPGAPEAAALLERHGRLQTRIEHLGAYRLRVEAEAALGNLGFAPEALNRPLSAFSGGWQMRAALARVLIAQPDILLLDEPSNYLDIPAVEWLCRFLKSFAGTLLLISHDRYLLRKLTNLTLEINGGTATRYAGDYDYYRTERENRRRALEAAKRNQDRKKEHLARGIERFRAKATKAAQARSWQKALDKIEDIELPPELGYQGAIRFPPPPPSGAEAIRLEDVSFTYPGKTEPVLRDISLGIERGEKLAFVGYNGTGKTTLLKLMAGVLRPQTGRVIPGHHTVIGYQAQEFADILPPEQSVYDVLRGALPPGASLKELPNVAGSFGFSGEAMHKPCKVLSGGEKIRLCFGRIFVNPPNLLLLDEPTTHLDVAARELLQEALRRYEGTVCVVSHDIEFVRNVATGIIAMEPPRIRKYFGNYDYYLEKSAANAAPETKKPETVSVDAARARRQERARKRNELAAERRKTEQAVARCEAEMARLEARQQQITQELTVNSRPDFATINRELFEIQNKLESTMKQWERAAARLEEILAENARIHQD